MEKGSRLNLDQYGFVSAGVNLPIPSNGLRVPVSRRNRSSVTEWFGRGDNVVVLQEKKKASPSG